MNYYESIIILKPQVEDNTVKSTQEKYISLIKENQGEILKCENWGLRNLAYDIKNNQQGFYIQFHFKAEPSFISKLEKTYKHDEIVIRYLTVLMKNFEIAQYTEIQPESTQEENDAN